MNPFLAPVVATSGTTTTPDLATVLGYVTNIVRESATWISSAVSTISSNGFLIFFMMSSMVGIGIGLFKRLTRI